MYQAPHGIELAANVFGRQGYPFPLFRSLPTGSDSGLAVAGDAANRHLRYPKCGTRTCASRGRSMRAVNLRLIGDLFNAFNANTALVRNNNLGSTVFNVLARISARGFSGSASSSASESQPSKRVKSRHHEEGRRSLLRAFVIRAFVSSVARHLAQPTAGLLIGRTHRGNQLPELRRVIHSA